MIYVNDDTDQVKCQSIQLSGPLQGKKIEISLDVKTLNDRDRKRYKTEKNSDWGTLGFLVLMLFVLIGMVGNPGGMGGSSSPNERPSQSVPAARFRYL